MAETKKEIQEKFANLIYDMHVNSVMKIYGYSTNEIMASIKRIIKSFRTILLMYLAQIAESKSKTRNCRICNRQYVYKTFLDICCKNDFIV